MAKNDSAQKKISPGDEKKVRSLNGIFNDVVNNISLGIFGSGTSNSGDIREIDSLVSDIITDELNSIKSITSDDMSTFLVKLFNDQDKDNNVAYTNQVKSIDDIFMSDSGELAQFFQDRYQNKNMLYDDLAMLPKQLFELDEAISTTRDAIITSDDITQTVSRTLEFDTIAEKEGYSIHIDVIKKLERDLKLPTKIKNSIIPYTLMYGRYYVYVCPYSKLFEDHHKKLQQSKPTTLRENLGEDFIERLNIPKNELKSLKITESALMEAAKKYADDIEIYNDVVSIPLLEGVDVTGILTDDEFKKITNKKIKNPGFHDGVVDSSSSGEFNDEIGCHIKFIDPRKIIPVQILDTILGYYYVHDIDVQTNKAPFSNTIVVSNKNNNMDMGSIETNFIGNIADRVVKSFNKKFLEDNPKFKDLVVNALEYNDLYRRQIKFQFIPKEYIIDFKVNEDESGDGRSILEKSLFYAKLYLALLMFKMITIITKSNDTRIHYVKTSGIDANINNAVQEVARSVKGRQINFMDLLNYNSIVSKIGANKEIFMPRSNGLLYSDI